MQNLQRYGELCLRLFKLISVQVISNHFNTDWKPTKPRAGSIKKRGKLSRMSHLVLCCYHIAFYLQKNASTCILMSLMEFLFQAWPHFSCKVWEKAFLCVYTWMHAERRWQFFSLQFWENTGTMLDLRKFCWNPNNVMRIYKLAYRLSST